MRHIIRTALTAAIAAALLIVPAVAALASTGTLFRT